MKNTLGIDLGSNSLGWAVVDDLTGDILHKGVVVFPDGIDPANDSLETPAAMRRAARMGRRMKFRRKMRKWHLLRLLIEEGMCPLSMDELAAWQKKGVYPVTNKKFLSWLKATDVSNPYCDRNAAAEGRVAPETLGRALYHICQRRGFKSSRKDATPDTGDEAADRKAAAKKLGKVATDIAALTDEIKKAGCKTLGQYFYRKLESQKSVLAKDRIRGRYTGRLEHYMNEFSVIMDKQGIGEPLRGKLYKAIFMQRPLRSQKHLVGFCPLETDCPRAAISHPLFEEFRMLAFVNNLSFDDANGNRIALSADDRKLVCSAFMKASPTIKFGDISKLFKKDPRFKSDGFRFHYYRDDETIASCSVRHRLNKAFGDVPYDEQMVFDALSFFDDDAKLCAWVKKHYPELDDASAAKVAAIHPREGNANYSLKAIRLILPFLRRGYVLSQAKFLAKLPKLIDNYSDVEAELLRNLEEIQFQYRMDKTSVTDTDIRRGKKVKRLEDRFHDYLLENYGVTDEGWKSLYFAGENPYGGKVKVEGRIPAVELGMIRNPLVQRSMTTLRRLVNYLRDHGQIDAETTIRIELARTVNDYATRKAYQVWQKQRETLRDEARTEIAKCKVAATEDAIDRYVLASEQNWECLYTGRKISLAELLGGNSFDVEHTLPRSLSGDDSLANKTICDAKFNRTVKKGMVPRDCPNWDEIDLRLGAWRKNLEALAKTYSSQNRSAKLSTDPLARSAARIKALVTRFELNYWREKIRRFDMTADKLVVADGELGFKRRQLVDTGVMSSHAVELLKSVYPRVYAVNGAATAFARKAWGIQGDAAKDRSEHTHHAKDAMVIAALTPARFTAICTALKDDGVVRRRECDVCPAPWPDFAEKVRKATEEILVKHVMRQTTLRQSSKRNVLAKSHPLGGRKGAPVVSAVLSRGDTVRGQLHKDTFYGCINDPATETLQKVVRKPLVGPVKAAAAIVDKIVDPVIRGIVERAIDDLSSAGVKDIEPGVIKMPSGVPINRVRVFAPNASNAKELRGHTMASEKDYKNPYYVTSAEGSNFRLALFDVDGDVSVKPDNSLDWAQNHKRSDCVPYDRQPGFVGYIMPGTMALAYHEGNRDELCKLDARELVKRLYKVVKFRSDGLITFRRHVEARASVVLAQDLKAAGKHAAGESRIDLDNPHELLLVSPKGYLSQMLFEGIHFRMMLDGSIKFLT